MDLLNHIKQNARNNKKRIVLPESFEERTLKAADILLSEDLAEIILIGQPEKLNKKAKKLELINLSKATVINPENHSKEREYSEIMVELRKSKGLTKNQALSLLKDPLYLATLLIKSGDADGEVAGADNSTGDVLRPAFQYIKTIPGVNVVSGAFLMILKNKSFGQNGVMVFADCAVNPNPTAEQLAEIAVSSAKTAKSIAGIDPRIAMLSFSTKGSAKHEMVDKVCTAADIAKKIDPTLQIDGEFQVDAAIVEAVAKKKAPGSEIAGNANVLVFPSLESGNIAYKLVERLAGAVALGPILQGLAAPVNDLSRGCSVNDIVNLVAITANQASGY